METWRKGSFRSASFFKRLSLGRPRRLRRQGSVLSQASTAGGDHEEYSNREVIRELRGRPDGRRLPLWGDEQPRATLLAPPKPPRLHRESSSCPNILEPPAAYAAAYSASLPSALSLADALHQYTQESLLDTSPFQRTPAPDLSDPFFSFQVDLGISLLEEVLQMLREQFPSESSF
uniref:Chromosome 15 open reading frame 62 n=1 Tax=Catagonus wagneri TaxID=51154 RepID=A0A8C3X2Q6_9CETA